jgi:hypothetical protein
MDITLSFCLNVSMATRSSGKTLNLIFISPKVNAFWGSAPAAGQRPCTHTAGKGEALAVNKRLIPPNI